MKLNLIAAIACASVLVSQVVVSSADEIYGVGEFLEFSLVRLFADSIVVSNHIFVAHSHLVRWFSLSFQLHHDLTSCAFCFPHRMNPLSSRHIVPNPARSHRRCQQSAGSTLCSLRGVHPGMPRALRQEGTCLR